MDEKQAIEKLKKQYDRQNEYIKNKYERINLLVQIGTKKRIRDVIEEGESINAFIAAAIEKELQQKE